MRFGRRQLQAESPPIADDWFQSPEFQVLEAIAEQWRTEGTIWAPAGYDVQPGARGAISVTAPSGVNFIGLPRPCWQDQLIGVGVVRYPHDPHTQ